MKWDEIGQMQCSVARSSAVLGDRWTLLILSDVFLGVRRFEDFQKRLKLSRTTLATRLQMLERHDVLRREQYQSQPVRYEYRLTAKGRDLFPVISTILNWGDKYYADDADVPIIRTHKTCGHDIQPQLVCPDCGEPVNERNMTGRARAAVASHPDVERGPFSRS
ncbi:MAG: helix-turn-helix domain-containing protein [Pseudomonadota bacterium]